MQTDLSKVALALAAAFLLPAIGYLVGITWNTAVNRTFGVSDQNHGMSKVWTTVYLLMPIAILGVMVKSHFDLIERLWRDSPLVTSIAYLLVGILVPAGLIAVIVRLWRPHHGRRSS